MKGGEVKNSIFHSTGNVQRLNDFGLERNDDVFER
jgi:hypothetical protein